MQITNRKAHFNYTIEEELEAGMILLGSEVKSLRKGSATINEAYVAEKNGEIFLVNAHISKYEGANKFNHEERRPRKLLLKNKQIQKLLGKLQEKSYSAFPLKIYFTRGFAKVMIGVGRGKKLYDKRESIKKRDENRRKQRGEE